MLLAGINNASSDGPGAGDFLSIIFSAIVVMLFIAALIGGVLILRKRLKADDEEGSGTFSMGGLRELVRQGKLTPEEFEQAKAAVIDATHKQLARDAARREEAERKAGQVRRGAAGFPVAPPADLSGPGGTDASGQ